MSETFVHCESALVAVPTKAEHEKNDIRVTENEVLGREWVWIMRSNGTASMILIILGQWQLLGSGWLSSFGICIINPVSFTCLHPCSYSGDDLFKARITPLSTQQHANKLCQIATAPKK